MICNNLQHLSKNGLSKLIQMVIIEMRIVRMRTCNSLLVYFETEFFSSKTSNWSMSSSYVKST